MKQAIIIRFSPRGGAASVTRAVFSNVQSAEPTRSTSRRLVRIGPQYNVFLQERFVYHQIMVVEDHDDAASRIAAAIGEPARARMLYCLMDDHARTSTELAVVADVSPSTGSAHLNRLMAARLVRVEAQGKHRYYALEGPQVARVLEALNVLASGSDARFVPNTPSALRTARTCYDHIAGSLGVMLRARLEITGWLEANDGSYDL